MHIDSSLSDVSQLQKLLYFRFIQMVNTVSRQQEENNKGACLKWEVQQLHGETP